MGNLLAKAARGFATAAVGIADDALTELRNQRMQEFQFNLGAGERAQARQDANDHFQKSYDLQKAGQEHQNANSDKSLSIQEENMRADNKSRSAQLRIAQEGLNLQKDNAEFAKVAGAFERALSGVDEAEKRLSAAIALKPQIDPTTGQPINDPEFGPNRQRLIESAQSDLAKARVYAVQSHKEIAQRFPKYKDYYLPPQSGSSLRPEQDDGIPPLLRRAMQ